MRLTRKDFNYQAPILKKLSKLEDILEDCDIETLEELYNLLDYVKRIKNIEDELGLDSGIFAKMLKQGGYIKTAFGIEKFKIKNGNIDFKGKLFYVITENTLRTLLFKDYGKTWALTEEELKL